MATNAACRSPRVGGANIILGEIVSDAIRIPIGIIAFRCCSDLRLDDS